jgi:NAD(P)-dependent dehydrogenase (short-subunit alcohol dehydrogenase family)
MARLAGKVAFITGGGRGIGRATAERFAEEGAKVVIAEIDVKSGEAAAQSARARGKNSGGDAHFVHCDIREKTNVEAAIAETVKRFGGLHILHNNAGGSTLQDGPVTAAPEEEFWRVIKLDLFGTFLCSKLGIPAMIKSGGGSIINMSSIVALKALPGRDRRAHALDGGRIRKPQDQGQRHRARRRAHGTGQEAFARLQGHREAGRDAFVRAWTAEPYGRLGGLSGLGRIRDYHRTDPVGR